VVECFEKIGGLTLTTMPTFPSPKTYGYRSKLTPHYEKSREGMERKLGFLKHGSRRILVDVPSCPIATTSINEFLPQARTALFKETKKKGGTLLLRDVQEGVATDPKEVVSERVNGIVFQFKAGEFFQNNPFILPDLVNHVIEQANPGNSISLIDAYCGGGLFSLSASRRFQKVVGIEISREGFEGARTNALLNQIKNAEFFLGDASSIFQELQNLPRPCSLIVDPPRKGCDANFLRQCIEFRPNRIVYVSCDPATQARDAKILTEAGYRILQAQPFDLFPQTRHIENVLTLEI
jgi:23S rRNA (uracil1939-C5)-methyltransferase/tRNA (uracil-5-)-methyltransferase